MNRLFVVSVLGVALLLASSVAVLSRSGGDDSVAPAAATAHAVAKPAAAKPLPAAKGEPVLRIKGVKMGELLQRAGVDPAARKLYMHALDDYHVDLPIAGLKAAGFLATRVDGKKLPIAKGGPIRLLFTGHGKLARDTDNWIWSFDSARVER